MPSRHGGITTPEVHRGGDTVNKQQAIDAAQQLGVAPGDYITLQSEGQINNPHLHAGQTAGEQHVDAWKVANNNGSYEATKFHSG